MATGTAAFLDTSIQIARFVHSSKRKQRIKQTLSSLDFTVTGQIVRQEFKRRLLKEAKYLLGLIDRIGSFIEVYDHVVDRLAHPGQQRKRNICLQVMRSVFLGATDAEVTERFKLYLHYLITQGLDRFDESVGHVRTDCGCACARMPIVEKVRYKKYEFGTDSCSKVREGSCEIVQFIQSHVSELKGILKQLQSIPENKKTSELRMAEQFIGRVLNDPTHAPDSDPCYTVGDLIISLESAGIPVFYTLNGKESQHLCRALGQTLLVGKPNPDDKDVECPQSDQNWPDFGP